jgi:hypothetical protein
VSFVPNQPGKGDGKFLIRYETAVRYVRRANQGGVRHASLEVVQLGVQVRARVRDDVVLQASAIRDGCNGCNGCNGSRQRLLLAGVDRDGRAPAQCTVDGGEEERDAFDFEPPSAKNCAIVTVEK